MANMRTVHLNAAYFPSVELVSALVTVEILVIGGIEVIDGHTSTGVVFGFIAALNNFFSPIQSLSQLYTTYQSGMAALDKILGLLDEEPELVDAPDAETLAADPRPRAVRRGLVPLRQRRGRRAGRCATSTSRSSLGRRSRSSARPERASRRSPSSSRASMTRPRAPCSSTATICARSPRTRCAPRWASSPRRGSCSAAASVTTSPSAGRAGTGHRRGDPRRRPSGRRRRVHQRAGAWLRHPDRRARHPALGRAAPARRVRAGAGRRPDGSWCSTRPPPTSTSTPRG